ncbi:MAG: ATP-binding protein [Myxococcota bacterium]
MDLDALLEGGRYSRAHYETPSNRVEWSEWARLCETLAVQIEGGEARLIATAAFVVAPEVAGPIRQLAQRLVDPRDLYVLSFRYVAPLVFHEIHFTIENLDHRRLQTRARLKAGARGCRPWMVVFAGVMAELPTMLGLPRAVVEVESLTEREAVCRVALPAPHDWSFRLKQAYRLLLRGESIVDAFAFQQEQLRQALEQRRATERSLRETLDALPAGVGLHVDGILEYGNGRLYDILGLDHHDEGPIDVRRAFETPGDRFESMLRSESPDGMVLRTASGRDVDVRMLTGPTTMGRSTSLLFVTDITARLNAEAELAAGRRTVQALSVAMPDLVVRTRLDGTLLDLVAGSDHPIAEALLRPRVGSNLLEFLPHLPYELVGSLPEDIASAFRTARDDQTPVSIELRFDIDERERSYELRFLPADSDMVLLVRDVTERRILEEQLTISERMASVGTLAAGTAHEINNPLTYLIGNLSLAIRSIDQGEVELAQLREELAEALDGSERIGAIVGDLKSFSRVDDIVRAPVDLGEVVTHAMRLAGNELRHRAQVELDLQPVPRVLADERQLVQVVVNLLVNAAQAQESGGTIVVRLASREDRVRLTVQDSGPGIPEAMQRRIFDPFFTTKHGSGTGLGLAIVQRIVSELEGSVQVRSQVGEGARFSVSLPAMAPSSEPRLGPDPSSSEVGSLPSHARVFVIDDEPLVGKVVTRFLLGHDVDVAQSAEEALPRLLETRPDLILCDLMMPGMTGATLYTELEREGSGLHRRMVVMSGGAFTPETQAFLGRTNCPFLPKPFTRRDVVATLNQVLRPD